MEQKKTESPPDWLKLVREKVETLRYGVVQIVIHDSKVTQIERTEKTRIDSRGTVEASHPAIKHSSDRPDILEELPPSGAFHPASGDRS